MSLIDRAKNIITSPKSEWVAVQNESPEVGQIITGYVIPLALIAAIATFIGYTVFGVSLGFFGQVKGIKWGLMYGVQSLIMTVLSVFLTAFVVNLLAPSFGSQKSFGRAVQLVAYAFTPTWVGAMLSIYPPLGIVGSLFGLYGIYLMYLGFPHTMQTPKEKVIVYMIVSVIVLIVLYFVLAFVLGGILTAVFGLSMLGGL